MDNLHFEIKGSGNFIRVDNITKEFPFAENECDRDWLKVKISVKAGSFSGSLNAGLMVGEFKTLHAGFSLLYIDLKGKLSFDSLEHNFKLEVQGDGFGHFNAEITIREYSSEEAALTFYIVFDQTFLPEMINQLENILKEYLKA